MKRNDLDLVCDAGTSAALKDTVGKVLHALAGLSAGDGRRVLRYVENAINDLPVLPPFDS